MIKPIEQNNDTTIKDCKKIVIQHKKYSESSYQRSDTMLTPMEFEAFEKRINKVVARYLNRYIRYCNDIQMHNAICQEIGQLYQDCIVSPYEPLKFDEFVDCCVFNSR